jgi:hypothetical protein
MGRAFGPLRWRHLSAPATRHGSTLCHPGRGHAPQSRRVHSVRFVQEALQELGAGLCRFNSFEHAVAEFLIRSAGWA